jgi:hypothetical protein
MKGTTGCCMWHEWRAEFVLKKLIHRDGANIVNMNLVKVTQYKSVQSRCFVAHRKILY